MAGPSHMHSPAPKPRRPWFLSRSFFVAAVAVVILGVLVYTGHSAHLLGAIPYLFLLACPLMHIFMHGGHGHSGSNRDDARR